MSEQTPVIGIVMGSNSDWPTMQAAARVLKDFGIPYEARVVSAHRTPDLMFEYADMMDTAGYYYKRISLSTYVVTRRYYRALFEDRLGKAHTLYEEFRRQTAVYDGLLENWAQK